MRNACTPSLLKTQTDLDFIRYYLVASKDEERAALPATSEASGAHRVRPEGAHYRDLADKLRGLARECRFPNPQRELLTLARRYDRRADHLDRKAAAK